MGTRTSLRAPVLLAVAGLLLALCAVGPSPASAAVTPVTSSACGSLEYGGSGSPDALIVSDLPLHGASRRRSLQQNEAIRLELEKGGWSAGAHSVAFQACDDSLASTGTWSSARCEANARAYAADLSVLGVIGTYNSGCAEVMIPILNQAPGGGLAMVSPGNTMVCLTQSSRSCTGGEPQSLYPSGRRNYARVVPNDAVQGAGLARFVRSHHRKRVYVLHPRGDAQALGAARNVRGAARKLGIKVVGFKSWNTKASNYRRLMSKVRAASPDAVVLTGITEENGAAVIKAKVAALGRNTGPVKLFALDGFAQQSTIRLAGSAAKGMFVSLPGREPQALTGPGRHLVRQLRKRVRGALELFAPYGGQAADVMLGAIAKGNDRSGVMSAVFQTRVVNGIIGSFRIRPSGDPSAPVITVTVAKKRFTPVRALKPSQALINAARRG